MRFRASILIALACALCSVQALAQDQAGEAIPGDLPAPGSSNIAPKYKATLEKPANVEWSLGAELGCRDHTHNRGANSRRPGD